MDLKKNNNLKIDERNTTAPTSYNAEIAITGITESDRGFIGESQIVSLLPSLDVQLGRWHLRTWTFCTTATSRHMDGRWAQAKSKRSGESIFRNILIRFLVFICPSSHFSRTKMCGFSRQDTIRDEFKWWRAETQTKNVDVFRVRAHTSVRFHHVCVWHFART